MAFEKEQMTEADKEYYYSFEFKDPARDEPELLPLPKIPGGEPGWVIYRERNAFLRALGGGGWGIPKFYALVWNGNVIIFQVYEKNINELCELKISRIVAPKHLAGNNKEIINMIKESLLTYQTGRSLPAYSLDYQDFALYYLIEFNLEDQRIILGDGLSPKYLNKNDAEIINKVKETVSINKRGRNFPAVILESPKLVLNNYKYIFEFEYLPWYIREGQEYKTNFQFHQLVQFD
ncbi:MAG: hypothetical protein WCK67_10065 [bacterium]